MGTVGSKTHSWIASTTFSLVPVLKHVLLDLCEHNRYESMVVQVLNVIQERINHPAMVTWLTAVVAEEAHKKKEKGFWSDFLISCLKRPMW